jgi:AcrR family transcriptional regulator
MKTLDRRPYRMRARAAAAAEAGVTVQTVIRRFGGRDGLFSAASARESDRIRAQREEAPVGDLTGAVRVLLEHYEEVGARVLRMLVEEDRVPGIRQLTDSGREYHLAWCARVFGPALAGLSPSDRKRRLAQLVAVCDVLTWKLLRHDAGLSRRQTERALVELLTPLQKGAR